MKRKEKREKESVPFFGDWSFDDIIDLVKKTKSKEVNITVEDDGNIRVECDDFEIGTF